MDKTELRTGQPDNVVLSEDASYVRIVDQTKLPGQLDYIYLRTAAEFYEAIFELKVRGAPAIGICAGFAMAVLAGQLKTEWKADAGGISTFIKKWKEHKAYLNSSRPTAVNLSWALCRMESVVDKNADKQPGEITELLIRESRKIQDEDAAMCRKIAEYGLSLLHDGDGILTHCNAGPLATSCYGTALGPLLLGKERGLQFKVFADETRPLLQGARLTSYELHKAGVDVTLICDNMASLVMKNGWIQACFVGCDRIAANGDTANKIGTSGVAVLARYYGIPFYVLGPTSTIDLDCRSGKEIPIELRSPAEIKDKFFNDSMAPQEVKCYNPAFDVTDHELISAIITEQGIFRAPYEISLKKMFCRE